MFLFWPIKLAIRAIELVVVASLAYLVVTAVQVVEASHLSTTTAAAPEVEDIVVLSAPVVDGRPGPDLEHRLDEALALYKAGRAPHIVLAGPSGSLGSADEPAVGASWLAANGVSGPRTVLSVYGSDASGQLRAAGALLGPGTKVLVVTDALEAMWSERAAPEDGLVATVAPAVGSEPLFFRQPGLLWRETSAVAVGRIIGFGRVTWS